MRTLSTESASPLSEQIVESNRGQKVGRSSKSNLAARVEAREDMELSLASTLEALAQEQGVAPVANFGDLLGDFWPENENVDDFIAAVREWRHEAHDPDR